MALPLNEVPKYTCDLHSTGQTISCKRAKGYVNGDGE